MRWTGLGVIFIIGSVLGLDEPTLDEEHARDIAIFRGVYNVAEACVKEKLVDVGLCLEMFKNTNLSDPIYNACKCLIPCVGRKMHLVKNDGTYDFDKIRSFTSRLQSEYLLEEVKRVLNICETEPGVECEGGFNLLHCALKHSHAAGRAIRLMVEQLDENMNFSEKPMPTQKTKVDGG